MFAAANSRRRDFGVLKAVGFSHLFISLCMVVEALILMAVAIPTGLILAIVIAYAIETLMPLYLVPVTESVPVLRTATASFLFAILGAVTPMRAIRRMDPSIAFRS